MPGLSRQWQPNCQRIGTTASATFYSDKSLPLVAALSAIHKTHSFNFKKLKVMEEGYIFTTSFSHTVRVTDMGPTSQPNISN